MGKLGVCERGKRKVRKGDKQKAKGSRARSTVIMATGNVDRCGYMTKLGNVVRNWRRRWFVLSGNTLSYFKNREDTTPAGVIDLRYCRTVKVCMDNVGRPYTLEVAIPNRTYYLSCDEEDEMNEWLGAISRAVIRNSKAMNWDE
eukprot:c2600_g1_i1.p1 GENE.c2600_g1_i1~~c2600_g1_i1.p1  ORF type:complete len:144 (-),score=5.10 c2600_g1_i1:341-772(-)